MLGLFASAVLYIACALATPVIWDGRAPLNLTDTDLDSSTGPFLTYAPRDFNSHTVAALTGSQSRERVRTRLPCEHDAAGCWKLTLKGSQYSQLLGDTIAPTALWGDIAEQAISVSIDNSSVFIPGGGGPQNGFRRTDIIAAVNGQHDVLITQMETGTTVFHFSVKQDASRPLNYSHEYQIVFIEPNDGSHIFELQLGRHC